MMEEIDMDLSRVYDAMDEGFEMINEQKVRQKEAKEMVERKETFEKFEFMLRYLPLLLHPYASVIDIDNVMINKKRVGWIKVKIPEFALITVTVMEENFSVIYWVHNPSKVLDDLGCDWDWNDTYIHRNIKDYRIALALAKEAWNYYVKTADAPSKPEVSAGESHPKAEVYGPVEGEFGSFEIDEGYVQFMIDKRLKHYGLI